jgi:hypothetical protein
MKLSKETLKVIDVLKANPSAYIIEWCEGKNEFDLVITMEDEPTTVSVNSFYQLKDNNLIEWQEDTDQWGDRYRLANINPKTVI